MEAYVALKKTRLVSTVPIVEACMRPIFTGFLFLSFILGTEGLLQVKGACHPAYEQDSKNLALRGKVVSVEIIDYTASAASALIIVRLKLEIVNTGARPLILLKTPPLFVGAALGRKPEDFSIEDLFSSKDLTYDYLGPAISKSPEWAVMRMRLDQPSPPLNLTRILKSGQSWRLKTTVAISVPTDLKRYTFSRRKETLQALLQASPVWIQALGETWPPDLWDTEKYKVGFGRELQQRWKDKGLLWIDGLRSEPMLLDLKKAKYSVAPQKKR